MKKHRISDILIWILSAEIVGVVSALLSGGFSDFYDRYTAPPLLPPAWLFPVVWTVLYAAMGFSAYLIHSSHSVSGNKEKSLAIYFIQLALNFSWSIVFFRFNALWAAFAVIILLLIMIIAMIVSFKKISPAAAYINIPYLAWVAFASYLNFPTAFIN